MKRTLLKVLKIFLIIAALILITLVVFGVVLSLDWPWWVGLFILLGLVGIGIGLLFLWKIWLRRREQRFVDQIVEQDESRIKELTEREKQQGKELQDRWKEAIEALRSSHLKKYGNPLYVLPWYLVIGESGSGKTTAIKSARLSSPFVEVKHTSGISGTKNCDWWFFEQAILIDTAGRYAIPVDEGRDKEEWQRFLTLLTKYRKKEPLNGLIVTVAADKLVKEPPEVLEQDGKNIRRRLDELMRVMGAKFPAYVMVTKCDLIQGMTQFTEHLPDTGLDQAMGYINPDLSKDVNAFMDHVMTSMGERLRDLRLLLLHESRPKIIGPGLVLFPEEFENLKAGLGAFMRGAFQENPYQETPLLRGLYFSSGRQEGSPYSHLLKSLGLIEETEVLPGTDKGLFLHDFFGRILPRDRHLFAPTQRAIEWRQVTRNLGLSAWIVLGVALCGLLSFSFVKNLRTIRTFSNEFSRPIALTQEVLPDLMTMERFQQTLLKVEDQNRRWWIPRFGLKESERVERELKDMYCRQFQTGILGPLDKDMAARMTGFSASTPGRIIGEYAVHLARRTNLVKARLQSQDLAAMQKKPQPAYGPSTLLTDSPGLSEASTRFAGINLYYLLWDADSNQLNQEMSILQTWLQRMVSLPGLDLKWLVDWENAHTAAAPLTLESFWGGSLPSPVENVVAPAFTRKGKEEIDGFLAEIEAALPETAMLAGRKSEFSQWYRRLYLAAWQDFAANFPLGVARLKGREEWQPVAAKMATDQGPYFAILDKMPLELVPLAEEENLPSWVKLIYQYQFVRVLQVKEGAPGKGILEKAGDELKKLTGKLPAAAGKIAGDAMESQLRAAKAFTEYQTALGEIAPVASSRKLAYEVAAKVYGEDPTTGNSPFFSADAAIGKLKTAMPAGGPTDAIFWKLLSGPRDFLLAFVRNEAACTLQNDWETKVLFEMRGFSGWEQVRRALLGPNGHVWKFAESGPCTPFVNRTLKGYFAKEALGETLPFESAFFTFLDKGDGERKKITAEGLAPPPSAAPPAPAAPPGKEKVPVLIKGLPTDANPDAQIKPQATRLEMHCSDGIQSLVNLNYPIERTFNWSPEGCAEVRLHIEVGGLLLTKTYTGDLAFQAFLQSFRAGERTFTVKDFPVQKAGLEQLGIKYIKVKYQFSGQGPVLQHGARAAAAPPPPIPLTVPPRIIKCWER